MSAIIMQRRLLAAILDDPVLSLAGLSAIGVPGGGVALSRGDHCRGVWHWRHGQFAFTPAGYSEPTVTVETVAEAIMQSRRLTA